MNYRTVSKRLLSIANLYKQDMAEAINYLAEKNAYTRFGAMEPPVDARDFVPMVALMGIQGETRDERNEDIHRKLDELTEAFEDPDRTKRNDFLNLIYYLVDDYAVNFDPISMNMSDPAQVEKLLQSMLIEQTVGTKKLENPEYFNQKYPTPESRNLMDACNRYRMAIASTVMTNLANNGIVIDIKLTPPHAFTEDMRPVQYLREDYEKSLLNQVIEANGNLSDSTTVTFPILDAMIPCAGKNVADITNYSTDVQSLMHTYYTWMVENPLLQAGTKNTQGMQEAGISKPKEAIYIDGQPFEDFVREHYPSAVRNNKLEGNVISTCILSGKHKVDIVTAFRNENGDMQYAAKTLSASFTPAQEKQYLQQFSWIRRTLFNWGPFRIETLQEKMNRITNDPDTAARLSGVIENHKAKIEAGIAQVKERARQIELEHKQNETRFTAYENGKAQLEATVAQWPKDSVIGILGQQITGTYMIQNKKAIGACEAIRVGISRYDPPVKYEKISPLFAKVLLYHQLCHERNANGGAPGNMEKLLATGNSIEENIQNTAENLAKDPVFQNFFLEKLGSGYGQLRYPTRAKFEVLIGSGGCEHFWQEYKRRKDAINQKEQPTNTNEKQIVNQKQPEASTTAKELPHAK